MPTPESEPKELFEPPLAMLSDNTLQTAFDTVNAVIQAYEHRAAVLVFSRAEGEKLNVGALEDVASKVKPLRELIVDIRLAHNYKANKE